nr:TraU family protein [Escherichia coli]
MLFLLAGHVPAASADSACEGRFVNPITDICWSCIFPLSLGSIKVSRVRSPTRRTRHAHSDLSGTAAAVQAYRLAIGYWEPMALTESPVTGMHGNLGSACRLLVKRHRERRKRMRSR